MKKRYQKNVKKQYCYHDNKPETTVARLKRIQRETDKVYVDLKLNINQLDAIEKCGTLTAVPWYYSVRTEYFYNIRHIRSRVLKDIHYAYVNGKQTLTIDMTRYTVKDLQILEDCGIRYSVCRYRIYLHNPR